MSLFISDQLSSKVLDRYHIIFDLVKKITPQITFNVFMTNFYELV